LEVNGELDASAALPLGRKAPVSIGTGLDDVEKRKSLYFDLFHIF
jgi:hypothetical protein